MTVILVWVRGATAKPDPEPFINFAPEADPIVSHLLRLNAEQFEKVSDTNLRLIEALSDATRPIPVTADPPPDDDGGPTLATGYEEADWTDAFLPDFDAPATPPDIPAANE